MSEVKKYRADWRHVVQTLEDDAQYIGINDYKNKCHSSDTYYRAWKHSEKEFDAAQSELAALREELAKSQELSVTSILMDVVPGLDGMGEEIYAKSVAEVQLLISNIYLKTEELADISTYNDQLNSKCEDMQQRLTAAEQRNALMTELLAEVSNDWLTGVCLGSPGTWFRRRDELMAQPTESGASE